MSHGKVAVKLFKKRLGAFLMIGALGDNAGQSFAHHGQYIVAVAGGKYRSSFFTDAKRLPATGEIIEIQAFIRLTELGPVIVVVVDEGTKIPADFPPRGTVYGLAPVSGYCSFSFSER